MKSKEAFEQLTQTLMCAHYNILHFILSAWFYARMILHLYANISVPCLMARVNLLGVSIDSKILLGKLLTFGFNSSFNCFTYVTYLSFHLLPTTLQTSRKSHI